MTFTLKNVIRVIFIKFITFLIQVFLLLALSIQLVLIYKNKSVNIYMAPLFLLIIAIILKVILEHYKYTNPIIDKNRKEAEKELLLNVIYLIGTLFISFLLIKNRKILEKKIVIEKSVKTETIIKNKEYNTTVPYKFG